MKTKWMVVAFLLLQGCGKDGKSETGGSGSNPDTDQAEYCNLGPVVSSAVQKLQSSCPHSQATAPSLTRYVKALIANRTASGQVPKEIITLDSWNKLPGLSKQETECFLRSICQE
ncbi:MAG: hypothetical protein JST80_09885 [Bdellovibrionales bacterium]|nr:hypothetical protein [Bdellovibrionales bacterium]